MKRMLDIYKRIYLLFQEYPVVKLIVICLLIGVGSALLAYVLLYPLIWGVALFFLTAVGLLSLQMSTRTKHPIFSFSGLFLLGLACFCLMFMAGADSILGYVFPLYLVGLGLTLLGGDWFRSIIGTAAGKKGQDRGRALYH